MSYPIHCYLRRNQYKQPLLDVNSSVRASAYIGNSWQDITNNRGYSGQELSDIVHLTAEVKTEPAFLYGS